MDWCAGGRDNFVYAGNALLWINKQPLPIERDHLNIKSFCLRNRRLRGIEIVRTDPNDAAKKQDDKNRNRPDDEFDPPGIDEIGPERRAGVGLAEPPGEYQRRDDGRDDDR